MRLRRRLGVCVGHAEERRAARGRLGQWRRRQRGQQGPQPSSQGVILVVALNDRAELLGGASKDRDPLAKVRFGCFENDLAELSWWVGGCGGVGWREQQGQ